jgi:hypothetical protein
MCLLFIEEPGKVPVSIKMDKRHGFTVRYVCGVSHITPDSFGYLVS